MIKITATNQALEKTPKKYVRLVLTEEPASQCRLVETKDGTLEYRLGAGKWAKVTPRTFRTLVRSIIQAAKAHHIEFLAVELPLASFPQLKPRGEAWTVKTAAENFLLAAYEFTVYKSEKKTKKLKEVLLCKVMGAAQIKAFERGTIIATYANKARDIANTPGDDMNPTALAKAVRSLAKGTKVKVRVLAEKVLKKEKMNLLLAVGKGAASGPRFIIMEYRGGRRGEAPLVLIGKGVTYDTGGLNLKPTGFMHDMHLDRSGGAAVAAAIVAAAALGIRKNVVTLIPAAENAISANSMRAGDIVKSRSGKTVEILHTDAEGRLILADALTYSERFKPRAIIDVATLTGAALVALGQHASALMTTDASLESALRELGEETGDLIWPLPLWDEFKQYLKSHRADVSNISTTFSRFGGAIEGGAFLSFFAPKDVPWAHLDIAPRMESVSSDKLAKGSTGEPVRLLVAWLERHAAK